MARIQNKSLQSQLLKGLENKVRDDLSKIKCPIHKGSFKNIKINKKNNSSLNVTAECCCQEMKTKLENYIKKSK